MRLDKTRNERGFTLLEITVVVLLAGIVTAIAVPSIVNSLREYRLNAAARQVSDLVQRARMQGIANSTRASVLIDTAGSRVGVVSYNADGSVNRTDYFSLPSAVSFQRPSSVTAPLTAAPTSADVSFPAVGGSSTLFQQDFNSRGFPIVATAGAVNALYFTNGRSFRAITINSVGAMRTWIWQESSQTWASTSAPRGSN